jgi:hypothetical protein
MSSLFVANYLRAVAALETFDLFLALGVLLYVAIIILYFFVFDFPYLDKINLK